MGYVPFIFMLLITLIIATTYQSKERIAVQITAGKYPITTWNNEMGKILAMAAPVVILLSLRYGIGSDYFNYENIYNNIVAGRNYNEIGYAWLMKVSKYLFDDYKGAIALTSILTGTLWMTWMVKAVKEKCDYPIAVFILITLYIGSWFNTIQQAISSGLIALAYLAVEERKPFKFYILIIIAGLIHTSAFVIAPFYFFYSTKNEESNKKSKRKRIRKIVLLSLLCIALYVLYYTYAESRGYVYARYITQTYEGGRVKEFFYYQLLLYIPELLFLPKLLEDNEKNGFYYILIVFEAILFLASFRIAYAFRMAEYFSLAHVIIIPKIITKAGNNRKLMGAYFTLVLIFYTVYMHVINSFDHIFPYLSIISLFR